MIAGWSYYIPGVRTSGPGQVRAGEFCGELLGRRNDLRSNLDLNSPVPEICRHAERVAAVSDRVHGAAKYAKRRRGTAAVSTLAPQVRDVVAVAWEGVELGRHCVSSYRSFYLSCLGGRGPDITLRSGSELGQATWTNGCLYTIADPPHVCDAAIELKFQAGGDTSGLE